MNASLRPESCLLAAACVYLTLAISSTTRSQAAVAQQDQSPQSAPNAPASSSDTFREDWTGQVNEYDQLLQINANACTDYQQHVQEGKDLEKEWFWETYIAQGVRLRDDEAQEMCTILIDAFNRKNELEKQYYAANGGDSLHTWESDPHHVKHFEVYRQERTVVEEAITELRRGLGKDSFKRLDVYYYRQHYVGRHDLKYPETPAPRTPPPSRQQEENPAPAQTPDAQP
jgi:hypothetical protein